jgi:hypothetical protein
MATKNRLILWLAFLPLLGVLGGCPSIGDECDGPNPDQVLAQAFFSPGTDSLRLGDTLYLRCSVPRKVALAGTTDSLDLSGARGASAALILREIIMADKSLANASASFGYVNLMGSILVDLSKQRENAFQPLTFGAGPGRLELEIGLVTKKRGIYDLGVMSGGINGLSGKEECGVALGITVGNPDPHYHYLAPLRGGSVEGIPNIHFVFKVY